MAKALDPAKRTKIRYKALGGGTGIVTANEMLRTPYYKPITDQYTMETGKTVESGNRKSKKGFYSWLSEKRGHTTKKNIWQ